MSPTYTWGLGTLNVDARIHDLRRRARLSKRKLATLAGVWRGVLDHPPEHLSTVVHLAVGLGVRPSSVFRSGDPVPMKLDQPYRGAGDGRPPWPVILTEAVLAERFAAHMDREVRRRLYEIRAGLGIGVKRAAALGGVESSWVVRAENATTKKIDLRILAAYVGGLGVDLVKGVLEPAEKAVLEVEHGQHDDEGERNGPHEEGRPGLEQPSVP